MKRLLGWIHLQQVSLLLFCINGTDGVMDALQARANISFLWRSYQPKKKIHKRDRFLLLKKYEKRQKTFFFPENKLNRQNQMKNRICWVKVKSLLVA